MLKFQNYRHYKLPITMNPLEYGKLIYNNINIFIVQINTTNIALISQYDLFNEIKLFREGDFIFEYKDHKIDDNSFIRSLGNRKFTYKNGQLIEVNKIIVQLILISLILLIKYLVKLYLKVYLINFEKQLKLSSLIIIICSSYLK